MVNLFCWLEIQGKRYNGEINNTVQGKIYNEEIDNTVDVFNYYHKVLYIEYPIANPRLLTRQGGEEI